MALVEITSDKETERERTEKKAGTFFFNEKISSGFEIPIATV
jgi:hypothetical protein